MIFHNEHHEAILDAARKFFWSKDTSDEDKEFWGSFITRYYFTGEWDWEKDLQIRNEVIADLKRALSDYLLTKSDKKVRTIIKELSVSND